LCWLKCCCNRISSLTRLPLNRINFKRNRHFTPHTDTRTRTRARAQTLVSYSTLIILQHPDSSPWPPSTSSADPSRTDQFRPTATHSDPIRGTHRAQVPEGPCNTMFYVLPMCKSRWECMCVDWRSVRELVMKPKSKWVRGSSSFPAAIPPRVAAAAFECGHIFRAQPMPI